MSKKLVLKSMRKEIIEAFSKEYGFTMAETLYGKVVSETKKTINADIKKVGLESEQGKAFAKTLETLTESDKIRRKSIKELRKSQKFDELCQQSLYDGYKARLEGDNKKFETAVKECLKEAGVTNFDGITGFCNAFGRQMTGKNEFIKSGKRTTSLKDSKFVAFWTGYVQDCMMKQGMIAPISDEEGRKACIEGEASKLVKSLDTIKAWERCLSFCSLYVDENNNGINIK